jgi:hypothetical protein
MADVDLTSHVKQENAKANMLKPSDEKLEILNKEKKLFVFTPKEEIDK